jgi:glycosyltransferase involved in cell wall biosynthesis
LALKRRHPSLGWLVDLGDPFSPLPSVPVNNALLYGWLNRWVERSVLQHSSAVAVTTQRTADLYLAAFPRCRDKLRVIPPLLSAPPAARAEPFFSQTGARRLVFVGSLYRRIRDPRLVLATLDQLLRTPLGTNLELHFVGKVDECRSDFAAYDHLLGRKVILHGPVERSVALQAMREADVLVSIGNATDCQLPSKLVEYVGSGKPIVNFASSLHDSSAEFLRDYPARLCVGQRVADAHSPDFRKLLDFLAVAWTPIEPSRLAAILAPYLPERIGAAYAACLEETLRDKE